jgi:hypothetical protein
MKFIPILFSTPMVQAIQEGRKTQTRREVNFPMVWPDLLEDLHAKLVVKRKEVFDLKGESRFALRDRFGKPGDVLWVRETFAVAGARTRYKADYDWTDEEKSLGEIAPWKPSVHMHKAYCRFFLEVVSIRVERLQDISEHDAMKEGVFASPIYQGYVTDMEGRNFHASSAARSFEKLWCQINGPESWEANPWVWVVEFKKIEKPENFLSNEPT